MISALLSAGKTKAALFSNENRTVFYCVALECKCLGVLNKSLFTLSSGKVVLRDERVHDLVSGQ
jgi:hypothetical protein